MITLWVGRFLADWGWIGGSMMRSRRNEAQWISGEASGALEFVGDKPGGTSGGKKWRWNKRPGR